jgi:hypothetical protein
MPPPSTRPSLHTHRRALLQVPLAALGCDAGPGLVLSVDDDVGPGGQPDSAGTPAAAEDARTGAAEATDAGTRDAGGTKDAERASDLDATDAAANPDLGRPGDVVFVSLNVGTPNLTDPVYLRHISHQVYEDFIGTRLRDLDADVVALQEVLPASVCAASVEADSNRTCYLAEVRPTQAERLLGPDYQIVCDAGRQTVCLGVHRRVGIPATSVRQTAPTPLAPCSVGGRTCDESTCDEDTSVNRLDLVTPAGPLTVGFFALNGPGLGQNGAYGGHTCRAGQLDALFALVAGAPGGRVTLLGDLAFDPAPAGAPAGDGATERLLAALAPNGPYVDLAPRDGAGVRLSTTVGPGPMGAQTAVLVAELDGACEIIGVPTFDAPFDFGVLPGGAEDTGRIDHRAVRCRIRPAP